LLLLAGCFSKPSAPGMPRDGAAGADAAADTLDTHGAPLPRLIANAYFSDHYPTGGPHGTPVLASPGMTSAAYSIATTGVMADDLLLFIGTIDNGDGMTWQLPGGFGEIDHRTWGTDSETIVVGWKKAGASEPPTYDATYGGSNIFSAAATITLIAVSGARTDIAPQSTTDTSAVGAPTMATSAGLTTTTAHNTIVYAGAADWISFVGTNNITAPGGYTSLAKITDHGNETDFDWTSQQVAFQVEDSPTTTSLVTGTFAGNEPASGCTVLMAIEPAP
jgi:hypothetical protein